MIKKLERAFVGIAVEHETASMITVKEVAEHFESFIKGGGKSIEDAKNYIAETFKKEENDLENA